MAHRISIFSTLLAALMMLVMVGDAEAVKLRRPYDQNVPFNYGFDNNGSAAGCKDFNCGSLCYDGHTGTDHPLGMGSIVRAGEKGTVVGTNNGCANTGYLNNTCGGRCGNFVRIRHDDGQETLYCHMQLNSLVVSNGQRVDCGQKIGLSASSGSSTGPHLHVTWRRNGGSYDLFKGSCGSSVSAWREQRGYREPVGTSCGCVPSPEVCDGKDNNCDGKIDEGDVCEIDYLDASPNSYAQPITTDINGDGLQDACGRFPEGWGCYLATGSGWGDFVKLDYFKDSDGWSKPQYYSTLRTGDIDGDGLADVCGRHSTKGYRCWRSTGTGFEHFADIPGYTNAEGWSKPEYYTTFRLADINGDGRDDVCARGPDGWFCKLATATGFGATVRGPAWTDASGYARAHYYGTIQTGDINGDGKQDVCIRRAAGFDCYLSTGTAFERFALLEDFSNDGGWTQMMYWSSLRLADFNGDGKADVCARFYSGIKCKPATASGFGALVDIAPLATNNGWDDPTNYHTLRVGDVSGDGGQDFCVRANAGMRCYGKDGSNTFSLTGPEWSDDQGWSKPEYYHTIMISDVNADRRRDLCARGSAGLRCAVRTDDGFRGLPALGAFSNANGWNKPEYYSTLRMGQGTCRPELCDGFDNNCNGKIDEGQPSEMGHVPPALAARFAGSELPDQVRRGEVVEATIRFENVGRTTWQPDQLLLQAVANDPAALAALRPSGAWRSEDVVAATTAAVAPGAIATFTFPIIAPADPNALQDILFVLGTADAAIACPSPNATLSLGTIVDPGNNNPGNNNPGNNNPGNNNPGNNNPGNNNNPWEPGAPDAGGTTEDAGFSDAESPTNKDKNMRTASTSSCASAGSGNPVAPLGYALLVLITLGWSRRRNTPFTRAPKQPVLPALLCAGALLLAACDTHEIHASADDSNTPGVATRAQSLEENPVDPLVAQPNDAPRLLAVYGDWRLRGAPLPVLPRSDAPAQFQPTLTHKGKPVPSPLDQQLISSASFVPGTGTPTLLAVTPVGEILQVDLQAATVSPLDESSELMVSVAQDGCCIAYMSGELGLQFTLNIADLRAGTTRTIELKHNAWSPAISPDATQVLYVASTDSGQIALFRLDLNQADPRPQLLVLQPMAFPSGPQPPVWTTQGIYFPGEGGAFLMSAEGKILASSRRSREILVDLKTAETIDPQGRPLSLGVMK